MPVDSGVPVDIRWNADSVYVITWRQDDELYAALCSDAFYRGEPEPMISAVLPKPRMLDDCVDRYALHVFSSALKEEIQELWANPSEGVDHYSIEADSPGHWRDVLGMAHTAIDCVVTKRCPSYALEMICGQILDVRAANSSAICSIVPNSEYNSSKSLRTSQSIQYCDGL